jgi:ribosomal protein S18 acetylase RimI-like enzyme
MKKHQLTRKQLKYFSRMAAEAYVNDPVHSYVTKNEKFRKKFVYHFMIERLATSSREDIIYIDEENRGICVWRQAHNEYDIIDFLMYPNWFFLYLYWPKTIKTLLAYSHLDVKVFPENTLIISPVFVDPAHQGKGIATKLIKQGITDLTAKGYKLGLEAQNPDNVKFYEKLGFRTIKKDYWKRENITNYYMMYQEDEQ